MAASVCASRCTCHGSRLLLLLDVTRDSLQLAGVSPSQKQALAIW